MSLLSPLTYARNIGHTEAKGTSGAGFAVKTNTSGMLVLKRGREEGRRGEGREKERKEKREERKKEREIGR